MSARARRLCLVSLLLAACSRAPEPTPQAREARLPSGVVASVGSERVARATVERIASAQQIAPNVARERAVSDAVFAVAARDAFGTRPLASVLERAADARALLDSLSSEALARGAPTDIELAQLTEQRWVELDRPESARTTHAVALVKDPADAPKALAVAEQIYAAVRGVKDPGEFLRIAQAVPHDDIEVRAERLPAVTPDGRAFDPDKPAAGADSRFDLDFAKAATSLAVGEVSAPSKSAFGYHVILCEARLPELRVPLEQRRVLLHDEVLKARAEHAKQELLSRLAAATPIQISRASDDLTSRVVLVEKSRDLE